MNERSLIVLTALALVTGILLLGAGHLLFESISIAPPQPIASAISGAIDIEEPAVADSEVEPTWYNESVDGTTVSVEPIEDAIEHEPDTALLTVDSETSEPTLHAPDLSAPEGPDGSTDVPMEVSDNEDRSDGAIETPQLPDDFSEPDESAVGPALEKGQQVDAPVGIQFEMATDGVPVEPLQEASLPQLSAPSVADAKPIAESHSAAASLPVTAPVVPRTSFPPPMPQPPVSPLSEQAGSTNKPPAPNLAPMRLGPSVAHVSQAPSPRNPRFVAANQPTLPALPDGDSTATDSNSEGESESAADLASLANEDTKLGEAPEETNNELQFLRRQTILLEPGQYQFDVTLQYLINESDLPLAQINGNILQIAEAQRKQRLLLLPIEFRLGLTPVTQFFVNVPFGWSNGEFSFLGEDDFSNSGGLGDISAGITRLIIEGNDSFPDVLGTLAFSAPTGNSNFATSLSTPGNALGEGFWTLTTGLSFIQTYDPIVVFYGFGYRHRFESSFDVNIGDGRISVNPGKQIFYRFGVGFAANPRVTLSASFIGSYITEDTIDGVRLAGSIREPMAVRLAATIGRDKELKKDQKVRTVEPFISFGVTDAAANALFGVSFTH